MKVTEDKIRRRVERFKLALKTAGVRMTPQRAEIFHEAAQTDDHPDAETIFKRVRGRLPSVSLDTVYRTLWLLNDLEMVSILGPARDRARYDANMDSHHHFVCSRCGAMSDFCDPSYDDLKIPDSVQEFGRVERTHVELRGICLACLENPKKQRFGVKNIRKEKKTKRWKREMRSYGSALFIVEDFGDDNGNLEPRVAEFLGVPMSMVERFADEDLITGIWEAVFYPGFESFEIAWENIRPDDLPGKLVAIADARNAFCLCYKEGEDYNEGEGSEEGEQEED